MTEPLFPHQRRLPSIQPDARTGPVHLQCHSTLYYCVISSSSLDQKQSLSICISAYSI